MRDVAFLPFGCTEKAVCNSIRLVHTEEKEFSCAATSAKRIWVTFFQINIRQRAIVIALIKTQSGLCRNLFTRNNNQQQL